ncbi:MAG: FHA domain-containing protein [Vicinamibacteria bacterium]
MNTLYLIPEAGGEPIAVEHDRAFIGRDPASEIHLRDASVSRRHAEIQKNDDEWVIVDCNSGNGVVVDGIRTSRCVLLPGQRLQLGTVRLRVEIDRGDDGATVILRNSPLSAGNSTMILRAPSVGQSAEAKPERTSVLLMAAVLGGLLILSLLVVTLLYQSFRSPAPTPLPIAVAPAMATATPARVAPVAETPRLAAPPAPAPPRATLLVSTDTDVVLFIDGRRRVALRQGGLWRASVLPGEHVISFRVADASHDRVVRANANEQAVVRFVGRVTEVSIAPPVAPSPVGPGRTAELINPPPTPSPATNARVTPFPVATPFPSPTPSASQAATPRPTALPTAIVPLQRAVPRAIDEGLSSGIAATNRGDFFRAVMVLKDVAGRLERDPRAKRDLALTHAYLAWAYHGLNRNAEAQAAADRAVRVDPEIAVGADRFPAGIVALFKRAR